MARAGAPGPIIDRLRGAIVDYVASAEGQKKLSDMGMIPGAPTPPAELAHFRARDVADWARSCGRRARRGSSRRRLLTTGDG